MAWAALGAAAISAGAQAYSARQAGKGGGSINVPPPPEPVDAGKAARAYLTGMSDDELQKALIGAEGTYRPQNLINTARDVQTSLIGTSESKGTLDFLSDSADRMAELNQRLSTQNVEYTLDQLKAYGPEATAAYMAANPGFANAVKQMESLGGRQVSGYLNAMGDLAMSPGTGQQITARGINAPANVRADQITSGGTLTPERVAAERIAAERVRAGQVQAGSIGVGALGESLYQQALQGQQLSPLSQALQQQGLARAATPGQLSAEEIRAATQGSREGYASSGRLMDNASITGEALARAGAARERSMQDIAAAQQINQQLLGASQQGQALATDVLRTDIQRQQANVGNQLQAGQFNVDAMLRGDLANQQANLQANMSNQDAFLRAGLANQQAGMDAQRFNITNLQDVGRFNIGTGLQTSTYNADAANRFAEANRGFNYTAQQDYLRNLGLLGQSTQGLRESDRAYNLNQVNTYGNVSNAGLNATGYNTPAPGVAGGMNYFTAGSTVSPSQKFDPNAGVNLAATTAANLSNYGANIYSADQTRAAAEATAAATRSAGKSSMFGNLAGAAVTSGLAAKAGTAIFAAL